MKKWFKTAWQGALAMVIIIAGIFYSFDLKISGRSSDNTFSPGSPVTDNLPDSIPTKPRNIIVFVADGMGFSHLSLAMLTQQTEEAISPWSQFEVKGWHDARSTYGPLTDSGASATALATGTQTFFEIIGLDQDGNELSNVFELAQESNYSTGIVTDSYIWDATPAAFVAHTQSRDNAREILMQIADSDLDLIFGELEDVGEGEVPEEDETLEILQQRFTLLDHTLKIPNDATQKPLAVVFDEDEVQDLNSSPNLLQLTEVGLTRLESLDKPFVLLVESEEMDAASHDNNSRRVVDGLKSIQQTLSLVLEFAKRDGETLVLFTSDHETGGLAAVSERNYPAMQIRWATKDHTAAVVPLLAHGPGAELFADVQRNWQIGTRLKSLLDIK